MTGCQESSYLGNPIMYVVWKTRIKRIYAFITIFPCISYRESLIVRTQELRISPNTASHTIVLDFIQERFYELIFPLLPQTKHEDSGFNGDRNIVDRIITSTIKTTTNGLILQKSVASAKQPGRTEP